MTLDYIFIPIQILTLKGLTLREKILLSLVVSFNKKGLRMPNDKLAKILDICPSRVSKILKNLERKSCVKIEKPQSRYRAIYLLQNAKVDGVLLTTKRQSKTDLLCPLEPSTLAQRANITKGTKESITKEGVSFVEFMNLWNSHENLPKIHTFTKHRKRILATRSKEPEFADNWWLIIDKLSRSPFHTGQNNRQWRADIDWLLKNDTNYVKILELAEPEYCTRAVSEAEAEQLMAEVIANDN